MCAIHTWEILKISEEKNTNWRYKKQDGSVIKYLQILGAASCGWTSPSEQRMKSATFIVWESKVVFFSNAYVIHCNILLGHFLLSLQDISQDAAASFVQCHNKCHNSFYIHRCIHFFPGSSPDDGRVELLCDNFSCTSFRFSVCFRFGLCGRQSMGDNSLSCFLNHFFHKSDEFWLCSVFASYSKLMGV